MVDRFILGFVSGVPIFRISKPGKDVSSAVLTDFVFREDTDTMKPALTGSVVFTTSGTQNINITSLGFAAPPYVILDSNDSYLPHFFDYYAKLNNSFTTLSIINVRNIARTIEYFVFENLW